MRAKIVDRLETQNAVAGIPEHWRIKRGVVQRGRERGVYIVWVDVPFLSVVMLRRAREIKQCEVDGIPY